jgi:hypothetical protein
VPVIVQVAVEAVQDIMVEAAHVSEEEEEAAITPRLQ